MLVPETHTGRNRRPRGGRGMRLPSPARWVYAFPKKKEERTVGRRVGARAQSAEPACRRMARREDATAYRGELAHFSLRRLREMRGTQSFREPPPLGMLFKRLRPDCRYHPECIAESRPTCCAAGAWRRKQ